MTNKGHLIDLINIIQTNMNFELKSELKRKKKKWKLKFKFCQGLFQPHNKIAITILSFQQPLETIDYVSLYSFNWTNVEKLFFIQPNSIVCLINGQCVAHANFYCVHFSLWEFGNCAHVFSQHTNTFASIYRRALYFDKISYESTCITEVYVRYTLFFIFCDLFYNQQKNDG